MFFLAFSSITIADNVNVDKERQLLVAISNDNLDEVKMLLKKGANIRKAFILAKDEVNKDNPAIIPSLKISSFLLKNKPQDSLGPNELMEWALILPTNKEDITPEYYNILYRKPVIELALNHGADARRLLFIACFVDTMPFLVVVMATV
jgi:hypothetical protein